MTDPQQPANAQPDESAAVDADATQDIPVSELLSAALAERDDCQNRLLRAHAELDNYRKRVQRERDEERRYAAGTLARDVLPVFDNLQRAIAAAEKGGTVDDLRQGVQIVLQQGLETLARHQITRIPAEGEPFDPNYHEALTQIPSAEHPPMTVLQEVEAGYKLHDRILRPSKVIVSSAPPESAGQGE